MSVMRRDVSHGYRSHFELFWLHSFSYIAPGYSVAAADRKSTVVHRNSWNICPDRLLAEVEQMGGRQRGSHG